MSSVHLGCEFPGVNWRAHRPPGASALPGTPQIDVHLYFVVRYEFAEELNFKANSLKNSYIAVGAQHAARRRSRGVKEIQLIIAAH